MRCFRVGALPTCQCAKESRGAARRAAAGRRLGSKYLYIVMGYIDRPTGLPVARRGAVNPVVADGFVAARREAKCRGKLNRR